ncbi:MAG: DUF418 domain-containing protein [Phycisphaerales bacterium]|nr:DUF418 domain-containing protein [Phycisphaerales bacterium]
MSTEATTPALGPVGEAQRIVALDVARGIALLGIFTVNIALFALPMADMHVAAHAPTADRLVASLVWVVSEYKFMSMFSMLFGMGLVLQAHRARAAGRPFAGLYLRRLLTLAIIGVAHATLLWYGDILFMYAVAGALLLAMHALRPRTLVIVGLASLAVGAGLLSVFMLVLALGGGPPATAPPAEAAAPVTTVAELFHELANHNYQVDRGDFGLVETAIYRDGPAVVAITLRTLTWLSVLLFAGIFYGFGFRVLGLFCLGAAMMKAGFFTDRGRRWRRWTMILGLSVGLPLEALAALARWAAPDDAVVFAGTEVSHYLASLFVAFGYLGAAAMFAESGIARPLARGIAAVGRMALTNYLGQTVVATFIFYWWGLGRFADFDRPTLIALVFAVYLGQIVFSVLWLRAFRLGPVEWLWRSATYARPVALRREMVTSTTTLPDA